MTQTPLTTKTIGILALQGDYEAHSKVLEDRLRVSAALVRTPKDLEQVNALILPGGESTTIAKLLERIGLLGLIRQRVEAGMPCYGTCAGMILMAKAVEDRPNQPTLGLMDITVERNAFGRQVDSFEAEIDFNTGAEVIPVRGVFIRAPFVTDAKPAVDVVAIYQQKIVGVKQGAMLATAFHPELTDNTAVHSFFVQMVNESQEIR